MEVIRLNNNDFQFLLSVTVAENESYMFQYNRIGQLAVSSSIEDSMVSIDFTYVDEVSSSLVKRLVETGCEILSLSLIYPEDAKKLEAHFVLDEVKMVGNDSTSQTYRIKGTSVQYYELMKNSAYFSPLSDASDVLKNLLGQADVKDIDVSEIEKNSGTEMQFISKTNEPLINQINCILDAMSSKNSIYFLAYNFGLGKYKIVNAGPMKFSEKKGVVKCIQTSQSYSSDNSSAFTEMVRYYKIPASDHNKFTDTIYINQFDSKKRKWTRININDMEMVEKNVPDSNYEFVFSQQKQEEKEAFSIIDKYDTNDNMVLGKRNRMAMLDADVFSSGMIGDLNVETGDFMTVVCDPEMAHKFGGAWLVKGVGHWFEKEKFTTRVKLSRSFRIKNELMKGT